MNDDTKKRFKEYLAAAPHTEIAGPLAGGSTLPICPKCKKIPIKCPYPSSCGMEDL